jgi:transglutaminase-like putative cysteine protease
MAILSSLHHSTRYTYDRPVSLGPQIVRLRPAPHCRTRVSSYSLKVTPANHFINWQQDPHGNWLARLVFPEKTTEFSVTVDLIAELAVINPFDFFIEDYAESVPFTYAEALRSDISAYITPEPASPRLRNFLSALPRSGEGTVDFLVNLNGMSCAFIPVFNHPRKPWNLALVPVGTAAGCWCKFCDISASPPVLFLAI